MKIQSLLTPAAAAALLLLSACSVLDGNKVDYRSAKKGETLEVPPDLTALARNDRYAVNPDGSVSASAYQNAEQLQKTLPVATNQIGSDIRIVREGNQRWLVVQQPATALWPVVAGFWKDNGFNLERQEQALGIMETDWAENRAKLPQDFIREALGKLIDSLYSTGERDKFRTRLESHGDSTEIYITHRGMVEKFVSHGGSGKHDSTMWEPRASDPELEMEFLRRLMLKLGVSEQQVEQAVAAEAQAAPKAQLQGDAIELPLNFDAAWRRVGLALDRSSFTISDRDRSQGQYFVRYIPDSEQAEAGFFGKLFGKGKKDDTSNNEEYRVRVVTSEATGISQVRVTTAQGSSDAHSQKILELLAEELK